MRASSDPGSSPAARRDDVTARWVEQVCAELGLDPAVVAPLVPAVLDRVRDVAHGVVRPGAPLTAFLVGLAAGRAIGGTASDDGLAAAVTERLAAVDRLVAAWPVDEAATD